jgi:rod shape-determining protein MreD
MPWGYFSLALLVTYLVQTAALGQFTPGWIDLLWVMALVCGMAGPVPDVLLAGWIVGLAEDVRVASPSPMGLHALAFGLAVLALTRLRDMVNREVWWVRWLIGILVVWPAQALVDVHARLFQGAGMSWGRILLDSLLTAFAAGLLAGLVLALPTALGRRRRHSASRW